jgi:hypothetical protein
MKYGVFWDVTPCGSCNKRSFRATCRPYHHGDKNQSARNDFKNKDCRLLGCVFVWFLYETMFRRNISPPSSGWKSLTVASDCSTLRRIYHCMRSGKQRSLCHGEFPFLFPSLTAFYSIKHPSSTQMPDTWTALLERQWRLYSALSARAGKMVSDSVDYGSVLLAPYNFRVMNTGPPSCAVHIQFPHPLGHN